MTLIGRYGTAVLLSGLSGCVIAPLPQRPLPLVAVPGPAKTAAEFQQDDVACRAAAAAPAATPVRPDQPAQGNVPSADQSQDGAMAAGGTYLHCMESRNNVVQPLAPMRPLVYAAYGGFGYDPPFGPYDGYSIYPWLYDGYPGVGFYGGYVGGGFGGGWRGGYGGGFHGGWGGHR